MSKFSCVGLIGRLDSEETKYSLERLTSFLEKQQVEVLLDEETSSILPESALKVEPRHVLAERCDLIIVVGGDGSLLAAARAFAGYDVKLLGINRGRLGFLTDISPEEIEYRVADVISGRYEIEQRSLLQTQVYRDGTCIYESVALNDVVVHPGQFIRMIEFELYIDDDFVYRQRSDGLIVSSPTGSTAYALSGGGPILHPQLDAVLLVPLSPHTLSSRPIVVNGDSEVKIIISKNNNLFPHVTCDGQSHVETHPGDEVFVSKSGRELSLIHPQGHDFYDTCRSKLGWANQAGSN